MSFYEPDNAPSSAAIPDRGSKWLHRFAFFTAGATLFLICSGGMVTSKGVGLAVPDWPTTFGYNMFLFPVSKWVGGIFFEHVHRLVASTVGFLTIILAVWLWRTESRRWLRNLGFTALALVIAQGVLGGLRVTLLKDEIGVFHACLAQLFFALLVVITLATSHVWQKLSVAGRGGEGFRTLARIAIATTALIYLQLALGATMRHQHRDLAIVDFPMAYGRFIPDVSPAKLAQINDWRNARAFSEVAPSHIWLQMAHRFLALVIAAGVIACLLKARRTAHRFPPLVHFSDAWFFLLVCQVTLGAWVIWSNKAADIATTHVAVGAIMLAIGVTVSALCLRLLRGQSPATAASLSHFISEEAHAS
ncbi:MAG: heme a synthase [Verrucomicrobiota bacterium]